MWVRVVGEVLEVGFSGERSFSAGGLRLLHDVGSRSHCSASWRGIHREEGRRMSSKGLDGLIIQQNDSEP